MLTRKYLPFVLLGVVSLGSGCSGTDHEAGEGEGEGGGPVVDLGRLDLAEDASVTPPDGCVPRAEECNGQDDDCDGLTDEDFLLARDVLNCGTCGRRCRYANAAASCVDGECKLDRCKPGFVDRDQRAENGCEERCSVSNGGIEICDQEDNDCNGVVDDGYDLQNDPANCGKCARVCMLPHAISGCTGGSCVVSHCEAGWYDVDLDPLTGCEAICRPTDPPTEVCDQVDNDCDGYTDEETDLTSDDEHCGGCNQPCTFANATAHCLLGQCVLDACADGWSDADRRIETGCEQPCVPTADPTEICDGRDNNCDGRIDEGFDITNDLANCGQCGRACRVANGTAACVEGDCVIAECEPDHIDADGEYQNGCEKFCQPSAGGQEICDGKDNDCDGLIDEEFNLLRDVNNCSRCGRSCAFANALPDCLQGECVIQACEPGFADIDRQAGNGCEARCARTNDGIEICDGLDNDCNGILDDGYDLLNDPDHCGDCVTVCPPVEHGVRGCLGGECGIGRCDEGWADGNQDPIDGCEYVCTVTEGGQELCDELDNDCDGETDEGYDKLYGLDHCGGCHRPCQPDHAVPVCDQGFCRIAQCEEGWFDANHQFEDGCELECQLTQGGLEICDDLDNDCDGVIDTGFDKEIDILHCGRCNNSCVQPHRNNRCAHGVCAQGPCQAGWVDLDRVAETGCEYACLATGAEICDRQDNDCDGETDEDFDLKTDAENCGQCGRSCQFPHAPIRCVNGICEHGECEPGWYNVNRNPLDGCEYECQPTDEGVESCDGRDNDCNGVVDDGYRLDIDERNCGQCGRACDLPGAEALCDDGECIVRNCQPGRINVDLDPANGCECTITNNGLEICDGLDNDCNGAVDDALGVAPISCPRFGLCQGLLPLCDAARGGWLCPFPDGYQETEDRCDGLDNDCDGLIDEPFPELGKPCGAGVGVCRGIGTMVCTAAGDGLVCSEREHPERQADEHCNGLDDDCDGEVDEESDEWVALGDLLIYQYEASHPDATAEQPGTSFARACSSSGHLPWTNVDWFTARQACARAEGAYLCPDVQWKQACTGEAGWSYPYGASYEPQFCNGYDQGTGAPLPGGQLARCVTPSGVFDLSGNVWEWLDVDKSEAQDGSIRAFSGGGFGNVGLGLGCAFDQAADPTTARNNIGFRCCTDRACQAVQCADGQFCQQGICHDLCEAIRCAAGQVCREGLCRVP